MTPKEQDVQEVLDEYGAFLPPAGVRAMAIKMCDHVASWGTDILHCEECPYEWERKPRGRRKVCQHNWTPVYEGNSDDGWLDCDKCGAEKPLPLRSQ